MYTIDFQKPIHVHFIGIGGISMSGLAEILLNRHFTVTGSDMQSSDMTKHLEETGAKVVIGQKAENITDDIDLVVYTAAIHESNEEFAAAKNKGVPMMTRAALLGQIMAKSIAVAGTHGKTTTTSMLTHILLQADTDPTVSVGGMLDRIGGNIRVGHSDLFLTEACEYTNSFLHFFPKIGVILNIDEDHLDFFKDLADIRNSFHRFAKLLPKDGTLVINDNIPDLEEITADLDCRVIRYGNDSSLDYSATNVLHDKKGEASFDLVKSGEFIDRISLSVNGDHNVSNALSAIAVADLLGVPFTKIKEGLKSFHGTDRRFEYKGEVNGVTVIDDYAHHPSEIAATIDAARQQYPKKKIIAVFQPHTFSRTVALMDDFAKSLDLADKVYLTEIFSSIREQNGEVSAKDLGEKISKGGEVLSLDNMSPLLDFHDDVVIFMGAGDIPKYEQAYEELLSNLSLKNN
mgnify:CR=1 FL=1